MLYQIHEKVKKLEQEGKKIIRLNVGDPDQRTDDRIIQACLKSMQSGRTKYGSAAGEFSLRQKLAQEHNVEMENVVITPGSKWSVFAAMHATLKKGDNIIIPAPYWTAYELIAKDLGIEIKIIRTELEDGWQIDVDKLEKMIDKNTKMIILSNPNNPTSKIVKDLDEIVELARKKKIAILSDECYADISFEKTKSILDYGLDDICIRSFSKTFAMTGWRIGYAVMKKELADKVIQLNQMTITNVPPFIQDAALKALNLKKEISANMRDIYKKRADMATKILSKTKLKFSKPDAPFCIFAKCGTNSEKLALDLIDKAGVAIVPGTAFGDYREYFRMTLTVPDEEIKVGLEKLKEALNHIL